MPSPVKDKADKTPVKEKSNRAPRGSYNKRKLTDIEFQLKESLLDGAAQLIVKTKSENAGRLPTGYMKELVGDLRKNDCLSDATRHTVNNHIKKKSKEDPEFSAALETASTPPPPAPAAAARPAPPFDPPAPKGPPSAVEVKNHKAALEWASKELIAKQQEAKKKNSKLDHGVMKKLIAEANAKFNLLPNHPINVETVRSRAKRGNPTGRMKSPMEAIEPALAAYCIQSIRMGDALDAQAFLDLANSLIKDTPMEAKMKEWKEHCRVEGDATTKLGIRYYHAFIKRHGDALASAKAHRNDMYKSLELMYHNTYTWLKQVGIARQLEVPVRMDKEGKTVTNADDAFGMECEHELIHPQRLLHLHETGWTIDRESDDDVPFTVLTISNALGNPVLCVIIFQSNDSKIPANWVTGIDITVELPDDNDDDAFDVEFLNNNSGADKMLPRGPACVVNGELVPCFCTVSLNGGMTSTMLLELLQYLDELEVYPRDTGAPPPFLILDGHNSRLSVPLLQYIHEKEHEWVVSVGVSRGVDFGQVENDELDMFGSFKTEFARVKEELVQYKESIDLDTQFLPTDIIPVINKVFPTTLGDISKGKKALTELGWSPMNRALLTNEEVLKAKAAADEALERERKKRKAGNMKTAFDRVKKLTSGVFVAAGEQLGVLEQVIAHAATKAAEEFGTNSHYL